MKMSNPNTLQNFISHIKSIGMPLAAYYFVVMPDVSIQGTISENPKTISLLCDTVALPGMNIMSSELRLFGEVTDIPYGLSYPPINMSFLLDNQFSTRKYFENWNNQVINRETRAVGYYENYTREISIFATDKMGKPVFGIKLHEVWPKSISDQILNSGAREILRVDVSLAYKYWVRLELDNNGNAIPKKSGKFGDIVDVSQLVNSSIYNETFANSNLSAVNNPGVLGNGTGAYALAQWGEPASTEFAKSGKSLSALLESSGMTAPTEPTFGSKLGSMFGTTGFQMGAFGDAIRQMGTAANSIAGPISAASGALGNVAGTLGSLDVLLNKVGINTGLGKTASGLAQAAGRLAGVSQLGNIPGSLTSVGANMGATGSAIREATAKIATLPGATSSITSALKNMGSLFDTKGSSLSNIGNTL